jgi:fatty-acyl-CoA synthase
MFETIGAAIEAHAAKTPARLAYWDEHRQYGRTYAELDDRTNRLANALLGAGLVPGSRVALWMGSSITTVETYLAAAKAGLTVSPINERFKVPEAAFQVASSGAQALVFSPSLGESVTELAGQFDFKLVAGAGPESRQYGAVDLEALISSARPARPAGPQPQDLFLLGYTSGTTGRPKGAMLTHRSMLAAGRMNALAYRLPIGSRGLYRGSMSFVATIGSFLMSHLHVGGTVVISSTGDPEQIVDGIIQHRCNYTSIATPLLDGFRAAVERRPEALGLLTSVLQGASAAPAEQLRQFAAVFAERFVEGWGMTEHSGALVTATTRLDVTGQAESVGDVFASVGRPVPEAIVRVVDEERRPVPLDGVTVGELIVSSPALAAGYWGDTTGTAEAFEDGWYYSGDLGTMDEQGYIYISDRRSDLIVSGGLNVYPREVESVVAALGGVREVAVVGAPHPVWGQTVVAVIVPAPGSGLTEGSVIEYCRREMAGFKKPTRVVFLDQLPKTPSEKVRRQEVRDLVAALATPEAGPS